MISPRFPRYTRILGVKVHDIDQSAAVHWMLRFIESGKPHMVVTPSSLMVELADRDPELKSIVNNASLSLPDGAGLLWAARMLGDHLGSRTTGCDLVMPLAREMERRSFSLFLLGGKPGVVEEAAKMLKRSVPGLSIAGIHHGYLPDNSGDGSTNSKKDRIVDVIRAAKPQALLVGMGIPLQEKWLAANLRTMEVPLCIGVGGTIDVLSGNIARAPQWIGILGLEWLYRAIKEPKRFIRLRRLPRFVFLVLAAKARRRRQRKKNQATG